MFHWFRFGVCCFFSITLAGSVQENCTYIRNPGFPAGSSESTSITYTVSKVSTGNLAFWVSIETCLTLAVPEVCDLRLDFETFSIRGPVGTDESVAANLPCRDTFVVTVSERKACWHWHHPFFQKTCFCRQHLELQPQPYVGSTLESTVSYFHWYSGYLTLQIPRFSFI